MDDVGIVIGGPRRLDRIRIDVVGRRAAGLVEIVVDATTGVLGHGRLLGACGTEAVGALETDGGAAKDGHGHVNILLSRGWPIQHDTRTLANHRDFGRASFPGDADDVGVAVGRTQIR
jgi:hypothetical protein